MVARSKSQSSRMVGVRPTIIRAMSFKSLETASKTPTVNFAVHLQADDGKPIHAITETLITVRKSGAFPITIWPAVEELCRQLSVRPIDADCIETLVENAKREASKELAERGQFRLARMLRGAPDVKVANGLLRALRRLFSLSARLQKTVPEHPISGLTKVLKVGLRKLADASAKQKSDVPDNSSVEHYYQKRLPLVDRSCCFPEPPLPCFKGSPANIYPDAAFLGNYPKDATKGHLLEREALAYGLAVLRLPNGSFLASDRKGKRMNFKWSRSPVSSGVSLALCNHKEATRARLARCGLPVARGRVFASGDHEQIAAYATRIGYPIVCKPAAGVRGIGVVANIQNEEELRKALQVYAASPLGNDDLIIEQHVRGTDYRIVVVGGKVVSAVCREAASIVGTGIHTVADLLIYKNKIRERNPHLRRRLIQFDEGTSYQLDRAQLTLASIPQAGQWVQLANSNNVSRGGDSIETLDELHPSIVEAAIRAVEAVPGLGFCGMDMMLEDHSRPLEEQSAAIIELNAHGAIGTGQYPMWGTPRNVARHFLLYCAEKEGLELSEIPGRALVGEIKGTRKGDARWLSPLV